MNQQVPASKKINLAGISIGDGAMDPISQFADFSNLMFYLGYADENEKQVLQQYERKIVDLLHREEYIPAFRVFDEMLNGDFFRFPTYFTNITGTTNYFNIMMPQYPGSSSSATFRLLFRSPFFLSVLVSFLLVFVL